MYLERKLLEDVSERLIESAGAQKDNSRSRCGFPPAL